MKRYILLSAVSALFFGGMNFGMLKYPNMLRTDQMFILNQIVGVLDRDQMILKKPNQQIIVYENNVLLKMINLYLQNNKLQSQNRIGKFQPGKPLKKIEKQHK